MSRARRFASSSQASLATTRATRPARSASSAVRNRPLRIMSIATALPTARVSRCVPPAPGMIPSDVSGWPKRAVSEATMRSHAIASSQPPPRQKPDTAATSGVHRERIASALEEGTDGALRLLVQHRQRQPVARVADRLVPRDVAPPVELLLRVARRLRQLRRELLGDLVDPRVQLVPRYGPVDEPPLGGLAGGDLVAEHD